MLFTSNLSRYARNKLALQCRSGKLHQLTPTCYISKSAWDSAFPSDKLKGFAIAASQYHKKATLTGRSAALLHELPVASHGLTLQFLRATSSHSKLPGVTITRAPAEILERSEVLSVENSDGTSLDISVTSIADTIAYIAMIDGPRDAVVAADHSLRSSTISYNDLQEGLASFAGKKKYQRIKQTMHLMSGLSESARESEMKVLLYQAGFRGFSIQPTIFLPQSCSKYRPDFAFLKEMVILEYDGEDKYKNGSQAYLQREILRHHELTNAGFTLVRIRKEHFKDGSWVDMLTRALSRGPQPNTDSFWVEDPGKSFLRTDK